MCCALLFWWMLYVNVADVGKCGYHCTCTHERPVDNFRYLPVMLCFIALRQGLLLSERNTNFSYVHIFNFYFIYSILFILHTNHSYPLPSSHLPHSPQPTPISSSEKVRSPVGRQQSLIYSVEAEPSSTLYPCIKTEQGLPPYGMELMHQG